VVVSLGQFKQEKNAGAFKQNRGILSQVEEKRDASWERVQMHTTLTTTAASNDASLGQHSYLLREKKKKNNPTFVHFQVNGNLPLIGSEIQN